MPPLSRRLAFACWDDPSRHRLQALFREAAAEIGAPTPPDVPVRSTLRFCDAEEFRRLLEGAGLAGVEVRGHTAERAFSFDSPPDRVL